ncbi:hypothetical protein PMAYCL1PPCAC_04722, partial [Pristionchus mayeri]
MRSYSFSSLNQRRMDCSSSFTSTVSAVLHFVLGITRLTAIALPLKHAKIWSGRMIAFYVLLWTVFFLAAIPLILPGSTSYVVNSNVFGTLGVEFSLLGTYFTNYSVGNTGIGAVAEFLNFLCYVGMCLKFRSFM